MALTGGKWVVSGKTRFIAHYPLWPKKVGPLENFTQGWWMRKVVGKGETAGRGQRGCLRTINDFGWETFATLELKSGAVKQKFSRLL